MLNFILASSNKHKAEEFSELFVNTNLSVTAASSSLEVEENGDSFSDNALIKAKAYYEKFKSPALADDSGLVLEGFPEILGVQSARYAPELPNYADKCEKILKLYTDSKMENRKAYFVCYLCFYLGPKQVFLFEGRVKGSIAFKGTGDHGFGYDPIFIPEGQTASLAELPEWKNLNSHRAKACIMAKDFFKSFKD